jgi:hypothetical protein
MPLQLGPAEDYIARRGARVRLGRRLMGAGGVVGLLAASLDVFFGISFGNHTGHLIIGCTLVSLAGFYLLCREFIRALRYKSSNHAAV